MPYPANHNPIVWDVIGGYGFDEICFICPWTITSNNESITVIITYIKLTFNYDLWVRVKIHPQENPSISRQLDINELHPLFKSLTEALLKYYNFRNSFQTSFNLKCRMN